jgi:hypothetical protein
MYFRWLWKADEIIQLFSSVCRGPTKINVADENELVRCSDGNMQPIKLACICTLEVLLHTCNQTAASASLVEKNRQPNTVLVWIQHDPCGSGSLVRARLGREGNQSTPGGRR